MEMPDDWYEGVYEHVKEVGELFGFDIHHTRFTGFWSQGDGASWDGYVRPQNAEFHKIAEQYPDDQRLNAIAAELAPLALLGKTVFEVTWSNGRYAHESTMDVYYISGELEEEELDSTLFDNVTWAVREYAKWIYKKLEAEYEHQREEYENIDSCL